MDGVNSAYQGMRGWLLRQMARMAEARNRRECQRGLHNFHPSGGYVVRRGIPYIGVACTRCGLRKEYP